MLLMFFFLVIIGLIAFVGYLVASRVKASERTWTQTDWRGGTSTQVVSEDVTTFLEQSNIDFSQEGILKMSERTPWHLSNWRYRNKLTFINTQDNLGVEPEVLVDFPIMLKLKNGVNIDYSKTNDNGSDIRFVDSDGTQLSYEIENWDETGESFVWVKVPQINIGSEDYIYLYYGNNSAEDTQNATDVWSNGYEMVQHLKDNTNTTVIDSTVNQYLGNKRGANLPLQINGKIGKAQQFANGDYITLGNILNPNDKSWTVEIWYRRQTLGNSNANILYNKENLWETAAGGGNATYAWYPHWAWDGAGTALITLNKWHYNGVTYDKINQRMYHDGLEVYSRAQTGNIGSNTSYLQIGARGNTGHSSFFIGDIDEMRVSGVARSSAWLAASYRSDSSEFLDVGEENSRYFTDGYLISNVFDTGYPTNWGNIVYSFAGDSNVEVLVRTDVDSSMANADDWDTCSSISSNTDISLSSCADDEDRYIQYRINITSGSENFSFNDISFSFSPTDQTAPIINATNLYLGNLRDNGDWLKEEPNIIWTPGEDDLDGDGLEGYCIALEEVLISGVTEHLDPEITAGILMGLDDGINNDGCPYIVSDSSIDLSEIDDLSLQSNRKYYFSIKAIDKAGNVWNGDPSLYQNLVWFKYDNTRPNNVMYISTPSNNFGNINEMFFTWPVGGSSQATDDQSGLLGWQYAINSSSEEAWRGSVVHDKLGVEYIPVEGSEGVHYLDFAKDGNNVVIGNNTVYFRAVDNAGNVSTYSTGGLSYSGQAPSFPAESMVTVTPSSSKSNSYSLTWPEARAGLDKTIKSYYYMINTSPPNSVSTLTSNGGIYRPTLQTSIEKGMLVGAVKGENVVYVVAIDSDDNYSPTNAIQGTFTLDSDLPDPPLNFSISDTSIKEAELWRSALTWEEPVYTGNGDITYIVEKSLDGITWTELDRITGNAYSDISESSREYYYRVATVDSSDESMNSPSYTVSLSIVPEGRFNSPAELVSKPVVLEVTTRMAKVSWSTDRNSDSKLQYGISSGQYFDSEIYTSTQTTEHILDMNNLLPGTTYYVRAKWTDADGNTGVSNEFLVQTKPAPVVEDVTIDSVGLNYAIVKLTTSGATKAQIIYGKTKNYGGGVEINTSTKSSEYSIMLQDLEDGTDYHYKIVLTDEESFEYESFEDHVFSTPPRPQVSNVQIQEKKGVPTPTIEVFWESNIPVNSIVKYSKEGKTLDKVDMEMIEGEHVMEIEGLDPDSAYQLTVEGVDAMGNRAVSEVYAFTTATDTRPPEVFGIKSEGDIQSSDIQTDRSRSAQLIISWETDEPSTSQVLYGEGAANDGYPYSTQTDAEIRYKHVMIVSNLAPSKVYHFKVVSKDSVGNVGESGSVTSITPKGTDTVVESVLGSLSRIFNFF
jgi:hypothetical protein